MERVGRNLILNSNFFCGTEKWGNRNNPEIFEAVNANGKNWLHIKGDAKPSLVDNSNVQGTTQNITLMGGAHVTPGKHYTLSAKVRGESANQHIYFNMRWGRKDDSHIRNTYVGFTPDVKETYIQYSEIAPDESDTITFHITTNSEGTDTTIGNNETNEFYVTDIKLEQSEVPTAWTPAPEDQFGRNLFIGSRYFSGDKWRKSSEFFEDGQYNDFNVMSVNFENGNQINVVGVSQLISARIGDKFTISAWIKITNSNFVVNCYTGPSGDLTKTDPNKKSFKLVPDVWTRCAVTFSVIGDTDILLPRFDFNTNGPNNGKMSICGMKLERGSVATPYSPAPEDSPANGQAYLVQPMGSRAKSIQGAVVELDQSSWTYDGSRHAPKVTKVALGGEALVEGVDYAYNALHQVNAGEYNASVFGIGDYDGTASAPWKIEKATNTITAEPSEVSIFGLIGETERVTLSFEGDGVVTVSQSAHVTSQVDGRTLTLTSVSDGADTLTVTVAEGTNYLSASCELHVEVNQASKVFENNSWDTIAAVCAAGSAQEFWKIGDEKAFTRNGTTYHFQIGGFDHDDLAPTDARYDDPTYNGGRNKAAITLIMKEIFADNHKMNQNGANSTSWGSSEMRTVTIPQIKSEMDQDLISVIRTVTKKTAQGGDSSSIQRTADDLFLMSEVEVFGTSEYSHTGEGSRYEFFSAGNSPMKYQGTSAEWYWLRSPDSRYTAYFVIVNMVGGLTDTAAFSSEGVVLCACI